MTRFYYKLLIVIIALFSLSIYITNAQTEGNVNPYAAVTNYIDISVYPQSPAPNENVTITIKSLYYDLTKAKITWTSGGKTLKSGYGEAVLTTDSGKAGSSKTIYITISNSDGNVIEKSVKLSPAGVDLVWEGVSFVPPFYKGRALFTYGGSVRVIALPHFLNSSGKEINPKNLVYKWRKNDNILNSQSGYGKDALVLDDAVISRGMDVNVEVSTVDGGTVGSSNIYVEAVQPQIQVYEDSPLYGVIYEKAISEQYNLSSDEVKFKVVPYFFSTTKSDSANLVYQWLINGDKTDQNTSSATFRIADQTTGASNVVVQIDSIDKILQSARENFDVIFNKK